MRALLTTVALATAVLPATGLAQAPAPSRSNSIGMEFVLIQPGAMQVGVFTPGCPKPLAAPAPPQPARDPRNDWTSSDYQACAKMTAAEANSGFRVDIAQSYYLGKFEVTQGQWTRVMGHNPSRFQGDGTADFSDHPVDSITWKDAREFVARLNRLERTNVYRLPTEFEWEYACRAGGAGQQSWQDIRSMAVEVGESLGFGAGRTPRSPDLPLPTPQRIGGKAANGWGLYDMLGNVWEWVDDPYNGKTFPDPKPALTGAVRVLKGGGFLADVKNTICATHGGGPGDGWDIGLRIARDVG